MKKILILILAVCFGCCALDLFGLSDRGGSEAGFSSVYFVAVNGSDDYSGRLAEANTDGSDGPLATLEGARRKVREEIANGLSSKVIVFIRGGEYELDETVVFDKDDSGSRNNTITYKAYQGEYPVFTGGKKLKGWVRLKKEPKGVTDEANGKLWYYDIPAGLNAEWRITTLYNGTELLSRARSPKFKTSKEQELDRLNAQPKDVRGVEWDAEPVTFSREFRFEGEDLKDWETPSDIEILLSPKHRWLINMLPLERIDYPKKTAWFAVDATYGIPPGNAYHVENAIEYLDEPGEWIYCSKERRIYIWPDFDLNSADIRAPYLQEFIRVEGIEDGEVARNIHFDGLTFRHGLRDTWKPGDKGLQHDWDMYDKGNAVMRFRHVENASVKNCVFEASSGDGVRLDLHCQRIEVSSSVFAHLGGTAILLSGYGAGLKDVNKYNTVTNNYIHHVGAIYRHSPGIFIAQSGHNLISHNTIHDLAYNGMIISGCRPHELVMSRVLANRREWVSSIRVDEIGPFIEHITPEMMLNWLSYDVSPIEPLLHSRENRIEYNEIYNVMLELHDGNGIYFSAMGKNNRAQYNYLHDIYNSNGYFRLDDVSGFTIITHNVGLRGSRLMQIKGPGIIKNNFAIETDQFVARNWYHIEIDNFVLYNSPTGNRHLNQNQRFPNIQTVFQYFDRCSNSLIYQETPGEGLIPGEDMIDLDKRGEAEVGMLFADPMFDEEAMKQKVFRFRPGSPAIQLGIDPIDLSKVGSTLVK